VAAEWTTKRASVASLYLDPKNPRLGRETLAQAPREIIQYLFEHDKALEVAESIATRGFFPNEPLLAVNEGNRLIVVEGNRRLAALKALREPGLLEGARQRQVEKLSRKILDQQSIAMVPVTIAPNRKGCRPECGWNSVWRILREHESIVSGNKVNRQIDWFCGDGLPTIDLAQSELIKLKRKDFPNGGAVLLRVFFELTVTHYLQRTGAMKPLVEKLGGKGNLPFGVPTMKQMVPAIVKIAKEKLDPSDANKVEKALRYDASAPFSLSELHAFIHQAGDLPSDRDIWQFWLRTEPLFRLMLEADAEEDLS
jgi:hypothetical protein